MKKKMPMFRRVIQKPLADVSSKDCAHLVFDLSLATLDDEHQGWPPSRIDETDVAIWWGHRYHDELDDELVEKLHQKVLEGMGLVVLHSGHHAKLFKRLMGTSCNLSWREAEGGGKRADMVLKTFTPHRI